MLFIHNDKYEHDLIITMFLRVLWYTGTLVLTWYKYSIYISKII